MLKFSIVDLTDVGNYKVISPVPLDSQGITKADLKMDLYNPYQLNLIINKNIGGSLFKKLVYDTSTGLKMETKNQTLLFRKDDQTAKEFGVYDVSFLSYSSELTQNYPTVANRTVVEPLSSFLNKIAPDEFVFELISPNRNLTFNTNQASNLFNLKEVVNGSFSWRETGLVDTGGGIMKTKIEIGTFETRTPPKIYRAYNTEFDDPANLDDLLITNFQVNFTGRFITHLNVVGNVGGGVNSNLSINFDDSDINASYIDPAFPIVKLTNPSYPGEFKFFVVNNEARLQTKKNVYKTEVFELDSNSEDENGTAQIQTGNAKERMYRKAVQVLKQNTSSFYPKFDFTAKRVILPGEKVNFKYKEIIDNEEIFNFNQTELLRDLNYNLLDISQTA